jgi:hypothetical protein
LEIGLVVAAPLGDERQIAARCARAVAMSERAPSHAHGRLLGAFLSIPINASGTRLNPEKIGAPCTQA